MTSFGEIVVGYDGSAAGRETLASSAKADAAETANSMLDRDSSAARVRHGVMARWRFIGSSAAHPSPGAPRA
jgi:hypothetical protein